MVFNRRENILSLIAIIFDAGITGLPGIFDVFGSFARESWYCDVEFEMAYANMMSNMPLRIKIYANFQNDELFL